MSRSNFATFSHTSTDKNFSVEGNLRQVASAKINSSQAWIAYLNKTLPRLRLITVFLTRFSSSLTVRVKGLGQWNLLQEVRYAFRQFRKSPGFTALAVVTLALGIGANTAMFTVVESLLLRPLPYANPQRLVTIRPPEEGLGSTSWLSYRDIRDHAQQLETVALYSEDIGVVQSKDGSQGVVTPGLTPNMFKLLGVKPLVGRTFTEDEGQTGGPQVVLLSEGLWRQAFNADPQIAGHTIRVNGKPRSVVGVMPQSFHFPDSMGTEDIGKGLWLPIQPTTEMKKDRGSHFFYVLAGLKPDATLPQAQAGWMQSPREYASKIRSRAAM